MRTRVFILFLMVITSVSYGQFSDTATLNQFLRDTIKDRRPEKVTAAQLQKGMLGITGLLKNTTASNGLTKTVNDIRLGGTLTQATSINGSNRIDISLNNSGTASSFTINPLSPQVFMSSSFSTYLTQQNMQHSGVVTSSRNGTAPNDTEVRHAVLSTGYDILAKLSTESNVTTKFRISPGRQSIALGDYLNTVSKDSLLTTDNIGKLIFVHKNSIAPPTIYNSNGILAANRTLTGRNNTYSLLLDSLLSFVAQTNSFIGINNKHASGFTHGYFAGTATNAGGIFSTLTANNAVAAVNTTGDSTVQIANRARNGTLYQALFRNDTLDYTGKLRVAGDVSLAAMSGNVGIGTTSPGSKLTVVDATAAGFLVQNTAALSSASGAYGRFYNSGTPSAVGQRLGGMLFGTNPTGTTFRTGAQIEAASEAAWTDNSSQPTYLSFSTVPAASATPTEKMRITAAGGVGIGTTTPMFDGLHVMKAASCILVQNTLAYGITSGGFLGAFNSGTPTATNQRLGLIAFGSAPVGNPVRASVGIEGVSEGAWTDNVSHPSSLRLLTANSGANSATEKMRITAAGNVGIGKTNPAVMLDVAGAGNFDGLVNIGGAVKLPITTTTTTITLNANHYTVIGSTSGGVVTLNLPTAASASGRIYCIKRMGTNNLVIDPSGSETIDGVTTKIISIDEYAVMIQSNGTAWFILAGYTSAI